MTGAAAGNGDFGPGVRRAGVAFTQRRHQVHGVFRAVGRFSRTVLFRPDPGKVRGWGERGASPPSAARASSANACFCCARSGLGALGPLNGMGTEDEPVFNERIHFDPLWLAGGRPLGRPPKKLASTPERAPRA